MRLVTLYNKVSVNPEDVSAVELTDDRYLDVRMKSGHMYRVVIEYGQSIYACKARIENELQDDR